VKRKTSIALAVAGLTLVGIAAVLVQRRNEPGSEAEPSVNHGHLGAHDYTNRLIHSKSPYLLQHAHNPVDWHEWGEEAFAKARKENKPIFLSVGYSTCHWCHVMEHESFENPQIAKIMNQNFVCIKVDREERPDVDRVYMTFVQATTGGGGWPMSVWLTPDLKPFFGGTYFPPEDKFGRRGFPSILKTIAQAWQNDRDKIIASSTEAIRRLREYTQVKDSGTGELEKAWLDKTYEQIKSSYEPRYGGFGGAPKFPRPVSLNFMLRHHGRTGTKDALGMSLFTLRKMADGGYTITSAADFTATRWMASGACLTSRRCCTTRRSWSSRISKRFKLRVNPFTPMRRGHSRLRSAGHDGEGRPVLLGRGRGQSTAGKAIRPCGRSILRLGAQGNR
jgi:hypothetical protein